MIAADAVLLAFPALSPRVRCYGSGSCQIRAVPAR